MIGEETALMSSKTGMVYLFRQYRIVLREILELERFPFDRQVVKLKFQSFNPNLKFSRWFAPPEDIPGRIRYDPYLRDSELVAEYDKHAWRLDWVDSDIGRLVCYEYDLQGYCCDHALCTAVTNIVPAVAATDLLVAVGISLLECR